MSYSPNIERRDSSMAQLADDMDAYNEERQQREDAKRDDLNRADAFVKSLRVDAEMAVAVLQALHFAAERDGELCDAELQVIDEAYGFIGGTP